MKENDYSLQANKKNIEGSSVPERDAQFRYINEQAKEGMVNVGMSYDTSEFAVESIRQWWLMFGRNNYPNAKGLMICADGGGSNRSRNKGWKFHLQELEGENARFTKTNKGLAVASLLDEKEYTKGVKFSDKAMARLKIEYHSLHPK